MTETYTTKSEMRKIRKQLQQEHGAPTEVFVGNSKTPSYITWKTPTGLIKTTWDSQKRWDEKFQRFNGEGYVERT